MQGKRVIDITDLATSDQRFPWRLRQLEYRLMQVLDEQGQPLYHYIIPPVVEIPEGLFLMGSDRQDSQALRGEFPLHLVHLDVYEIALHPLTICEFLLYLQATGLLASTSEYRMLYLHRPVPPGYRKPEPHLYLDYPAEGITWHEATAYANWLAQVSGELWRLPTEAEWEKAARGLDARIYPWGDEWDKDKANTWDGEEHETTPIGSYPDGRSPYGVYDMAGNVFEWTSSRSKPYPYTEAEKDALSYGKSVKLVARGSAASVHPLHARAAARPGFLLTAPLGMRLARGKSGTFLEAPLPQT